MPSHYTHLLFGRKVMSAMPEDMRNRLWSHKSCFLAGLQGPDPLFYYHPLTKNPVKALGVQIHQESGILFFSHAARVLSRDGTPQQWSYAAGCICHYMLDTACHPFIDGELAKCGIPHLEIETELDSSLLLGSGLDLYRTNPMAHLRPGAELTKAAAPFYPILSPRQVDGAFRAMKRLVPLTRLKNNALRGGVRQVMRLSGMKEEDTGMLVEPALKPHLQEAVAALTDMVWNEVTPTVEELSRFFETVEQGAPLSRRFDKNFDGQEVLL